MSNQIKKICSWTLMLIMALSAFQNSIAMDFVHNKQGVECRMAQKSVANTDVLKADGNCPTEHGESTCIDIRCLSQLNLSSLHPVHARILPARAEFLQKLLPDCNAIFSHYPDLLKRPPKA